ncbi:hypothetical protein Tco_1326057 [Tanacetum coccineum]
MTINSNLLPQIHEARVESLKKENVKDENLHGMDKELENRLDGTLCIKRRSWLPCARDLGELIQHEPHKPNYFIHPVSPIARYGSMHRQLGQQMLDVFKDEGRLSKAIRIGYPMPWLEPSPKTPLDGTSPTPHLAFLSVEPPPPHQMVSENAM